MVKLVMDCMGGDHSPSVNIEGSITAMKEFEDLSMVFCGDETQIKAELSKYQYDEKRVEIVHASEVIDCHDSSVDALQKKKDSSIVKSLSLMRKDPSVNGLVSIGSSGAVFAGAVLNVGRIKGVIRPAFCPVLPTMPGGVCGICDSGANTDPTPDMLHQYAVMGSLYMQKAYGIEKPRIALLNVGTEDEKGDNLRKAVFPLLKAEEKINFVGNMESRDFLSGKYDLVVCDAFSGNVLIKSTEGACLELLKLLKKTFYSSLKNKIGAALMKKDIYRIKDQMDYNNYGGAVLLGTKKLIVKGHGNCKPTSIYHCVKLAYTMHKNGLCEAMADAFAQD